jgi:hypothetical protein
MACEVVEGDGYLLDWKTDCHLLDTFAAFTCHRLRGVVKEIRSDPAMRNRVTLHEVKTPDMKSS